jgi:hypothetical protein
MPNVPDLIRESLTRYAGNRVPTGGFLGAVLANDLFAAAGRADDVNRHYLWDICVFVMGTLPRESYGSWEKVRAWVRREV